MTIKQRQYFQNVSQQKKMVVLGCKKQKLSEAVSEELIEQGGVSKKQWNATAHQLDAVIPENGCQNAEISPQKIEIKGGIEDERVCPREEKLLVEGKLTEGGNNHLLILANFAELMSKFEDNVNPQDHEVLDSTMEAQDLQESVNDVMALDTDKNWDKDEKMPLISHERKETDGSHSEGTVTRLSEIQSQACRQSFMQQSIQEDTYKRLQGSKIRLTQIRRQARSGNDVFGQVILEGYSHGKLLGGITRLSQIRRQARSKSSCSRQEGTGEHMHRRLDCHFHEVNKSEDIDRTNHQKRDAAAEQCANLGWCQVIGVSSSSSVDAKANGDKVCEKGGLRLSQLRRKVRLGNANLVALRNA